jgi:hypothetical protein
MEVHQPPQSMPPGSYDENGQQIGRNRYSCLIRKSSCKIEIRRKKFKYLAHSYL